MHYVDVWLYFTTWACLYQAAHLMYPSRVPSTYCLSVFVGITGTVLMLRAERVREMPPIFRIPSHAVHLVMPVLHHLRGSPMACTASTLYVPVMMYTVLLGFENILCIYDRMYGSEMSLWDRCLTQKKPGHEVLGGDKTTMHEGM